MDRRLVEIDALKVAGIATVILIHCLRSPWEPLISQLEVWLGHLTRFGVPAFLLASGFLYASDAPVGWPETRRRLRRILLPYLCVSLAAQAWWALLGVPTDTGSLWRDLAFGSSMGAFYYVFVITGLVALTPLFSRLPPALLAGASLVMLGAQWWVDAAVGLELDLYWHFRSPLLWWAYFLVGWQLRRHHAGVVGWVARRGVALPLALAVVVAALAAGSAASGPTVAVRSAAWLGVYAILALIFVASCRIARAPPALAFLSDASYAIFLLHLFFVTSMQRYWPAPPLRADPLAIALPWLAGLLGPIVLIAALRQLLGRHSRDVVGA